jgi:hypothetical protein
MSDFIVHVIGTIKYMIVSYQYEDFFITDIKHLFTTSLCIWMSDQFLFLLSKRLIFDVLPSDSKR